MFRFLHWGEIELAIHANIEKHVLEVETITLFLVVGQHVFARIVSVVGTPEFFDDFVDIGLCCCR